MEILEQIVEMINENVFFCSDNEDYFTMRGANCSAGASKMCWDFKDLPYVIKTGFDGDYYMDEPDYWDDDPILDEYNSYKQMEAMGFGDFVAKCELVTVNGRNFLLSERVKPHCNYNKAIHRSEISEEAEDWLKNVYFTPNYIWKRELIAQFGLEKVKSFFKYVITDNNFSWADDLHAGNYGWTVDGVPKILDYGDIDKYLQSTHYPSYPYSSESYESSNVSIRMNF